MSRIGKSWKISYNFNHFNLPKLFQALESIKKINNIQLHSKKWASRATVRLTNPPTCMNYFNISQILLFFYSFFAFFVFKQAWINHLHWYVYCICAFVALWTSVIAYCQVPDWQKECSSDIDLYIRHIPQPNVSHIVVKK